MPKLKWIKRGKLFDPAEHETAPWMHEYAQLPFPLDVGGGVLRVYFATRPKRGGDQQYISRSGYVDLNKNSLHHILNISKEPIIDLGNAGSFDEFGCMTSSFVRYQGQVYAYYTGWTRMQSVPYTMAIGMATSNDGGETFVKYSKGPILGITYKEPYLISGPIVRRINRRWHMWYITGIQWLSYKNKLEPVYKIVHATSKNGIDWIRDGKPIIPSIYDDECQVSFALFQYRNYWNVIFAYRRPIDFRENSNNSYRLGYAWSTDLVNWQRDDSLSNLDVSHSGWDSEMLAYPQVCELDNRILLFYCGNNFGFNGFGYAELDA